VAFSYREGAGCRPRRWRKSAAARDPGRGRCVAIQQELNTPGDGRALVGRSRARVWADWTFWWRIMAYGRQRMRPSRKWLRANGGRPWPSIWMPFFGMVQAAVGPDGGPTAGWPARARGHIVLISSTAGQRGEANHADYAVSQRSAESALPRVCRASLRPRGFYVNCVAPGWGEHRDVGCGARPPQAGREDCRGYSLGTRGQPTRDCRTGAVSVYAAGRISSQAKCSTSTAGAVLVG